MKFLGLHIKVTMPKLRIYNAADKGRRGKSFRNAKSTGANREIAGALVALRDRSRHMVRNNGWANRAVEAITRHTIGEGIQPAPVGDLFRTKEIKRMWRDWAGSTDCDWYGKTTFYGLQELAMRAIVEGGDMLILKHWATDNPSGIPLKLQLMEGDLLDHSRNGTNEQGFARMGVQFSKAGELTGYWLFGNHPGDNDVIFTKWESTFYPKSDVIHAFEILRVGQVRGLPFGVASFMKMSDFGDYEDAQLMKQKVAAAFATFITGAEDAPTKGDDDRREDIEPGMIEYLNNGETVTFSDPPSVSDYDSYSARILQGIASAYGITYEMLTMDYSRVNFTSGRMAKIDVTANFKSWQYNMIVPQLCAPVWQWFMDACLIAGKLHKPIKADWTAPRVQQLDPVKETNAQIMKLKAGLSTWSETIREIGREPEEFFAELEQDIARFKKAGLNYGEMIVSVNKTQ
ncbi:phage portal protein [Bacteroidia bacterium]|nr:phage portal protein [Bacteroidia bacterium]GHT04895.1 phage portal protein [Bacteroidia bacterium]